MTSTLVSFRIQFGWLILAMLCLCHADIAVAEKIDGDQLLEPNRLIEVRIEISSDDWVQLSRQARNAATAFSGLPSESPYTYFQADVSIDGVKIESVGIRKKGFFGSADFQRPSLKIKFDEYKEQDPIEGLSRLTLNNNKQDRSQLSQFLTYRLFRNAGNPAPRSNWAHVIVNDESLGIYSNVESIKKPFLLRNFEDKSGNLYEGALTDFHPNALGNIEVKTNEKANDLSDIKRLAKVLGEEGDLDLDEVGKMIDLDAFFRHWALESLTGYWDGYSSNQNNYYLYFNPKDEGRGHFIPWGADWAFSNGGPFAGGQFGSGSRATTVIYAQSILANRLYHTSEGPVRYRATMQRLLDDAWDEDKMIEEIDRVEKLVSPHLHASQAGTPQVLNELRDFIRGRRAAVKKSLEDWRPNIPSEPRTPAHVVDVGKASGSFSTVFSASRSDQSKESTSDVQVELEGKPVDFESWSVRPQQFQAPTFGGFGGPGGGQRGGAGGQRGGAGGQRGGGFGQPRGSDTEDTQAPPAPVRLVLTGERSGEEPITVSLIIDRKKFESATEEAIGISGSYQEGRGGGFGFGGGPGRSVVGNLRLTKSGIEPGDEVAGSIELRIVETRGGFFQQRRPAGGFGSGNSRGQSEQRLSLSVLQALDKDRNGTISAQEIDQAETVLKELDRNGDGTLSGDELQSPTRGQPQSGAETRDRSMERQRPELDENAASKPAEPAPRQDADKNSNADPVVMTTEQDHRNMMAQLGITQLRPGPSGNADAPNAANYDEAKANPYPALPDVLTLNNGRKVTSAEQWWKLRRPEIVEEFDREILGRVPKDVPNVKWELLKTVEKKLGETEVIEKRLAGRVDNTACPEISVTIMMSVVTPKALERPVPTLMMFGFTMFGPDGEDVDLGGRFGGFGRREGGPPPTTQQLVEAGWGYASINTNSIQEDSGGERQRRFGPPRPEGQTGGGLTRGIIGLTNKGQPRKPDQWGSLRAWAWGASRGLDYLESDSRVDAKRVGIEGVSRYGKAALVTMAYDQRFAMGLIGSSGEGGASLYRRNFGEAVESLTSSGEYHWMAGNFLKYGTAKSSFGSRNADDLPVDAHQLVALCAPRPTFISYGVPEKGDALWLDQRGSFMATVAAQPAYRLLGGTDLGRSERLHERKDASRQRRSPYR